MVYHCFFVLWCLPGPVCAWPCKAHSTAAVVHATPAHMSHSSCLQSYTGLRTLYLESNAISIIEGLDALSNLRSLYLAKNLISSLCGLQSLTQLEVLDVSHNRISTCSGLSSLVSLSSLSLSSNRLSTAADLSELCFCTRLVTLDLSCNQLGAEGLLELISGAKWQLCLLRLQGNPLVGQIE